MNDLTCSFRLLSVKLRHWLFMANYGLFPGIRLWGRRGGGRGEGRFSFFAYKEMCRWTRYGFWVFRIQFQVVIMHFYQPACPLKAIPKFRANYLGTSYFSGSSYFKPVPWCTYTLTNDPIYPRTPRLSALGGYSVMAYTGSFRQRGAFFRLNVYKR